MKILYSPQVNEIDNLTYVFEGDKITATLNGETDVFDFTGFPIGRVENIQSMFSYTLVLDANRDTNNVLHVVLLKFIGRNATEEARFPVEVDV